MVGAVGPRFEKANVMDMLLYIDDGNHDQEMAKIIFGQERYKEFTVGKDGKKITAEYQSEVLGKKVDVYVDLLQERYRITYGAYLQYVIAMMKDNHPGSRAYVFMTGLGAGAWSLPGAAVPGEGPKPDTIKQNDLIANAVYGLLSKMEPEDLKLIAVVDFAYVHISKGKVGYSLPDASPASEQTKVRFGSERNPASKKPFVHGRESIEVSDLIWFEEYAWDGNSLPGIILNTIQTLCL